MAYRIASAIFQGTNTATSPALNCTGAGLLVFMVASTNGVNGTLSDSQSNPYQILTTFGNSFGQIIIWYAGSNAAGAGTGAPSTSSSMLFNVTGTAGLFCGMVVAYGNAQITSNPLDQNNGNSGASGGTAQPNAITPSQNNDICVTGIFTNNPGGSALTIDSSFSIAQQSNAVAATYYGGAIADLFQGTAATVQPTWTLSGNSAICPVAIASFFASPGGGFTWQPLGQGQSEPVPVKREVVSYKRRDYARRESGIYAPL